MPSEPPAVSIPVIDCRRDAAEPLFRALRDKLSPRGDIVSEAGRQRTIELFGEPISPEQVVERICRDVADRRLEAVLHYTSRLDRCELTADTLRVPADELETARSEADPRLLATIRRIADNIRDFQKSILHKTVRLKRTLGHGRVELQQRYTPLRRVGVCVPGGAAAYPSTLLMTIVPAQVAGVPEIAVVVPPTPHGAYNRDVLATCAELGVREVYRVGGAQAVAALAHGLDVLPAVDKIVGPGNLFVALAKKFVYGLVDIDSIAGPSEVVLIADKTARPAFVASDLISQAEHSPGSGVLITWHEPLVEQVQRELVEQLSALPRGDLARTSLEDHGALVIARDVAEAVRLTDELAPEHLHLSVADPHNLLEQIKNAGAIFLGHYTPVAVGDYFAGPSHVLPTGGTARFANGLTANAFLKSSSVISYDAEALLAAADDIRRLAAVEGLTAHSHSVDVRLTAE
jgi:histidinol dehydrogenase